ncbi:ribose 5-phosphate isomerase B [Pedobacter sp. MC2016-05]|uniref:ribose 5-phosphate isomerase B n=1 Tax=Pedobacter sp. MC2016-05 TaxID=2994474 RepID=UPI0022479789|nr:ribose 5-phosphate isomerase B [Pedobacter sp. MC2016-05]MCX2475234.1 ribose 5-phosphate isomerase B [Pedobacter sp. MC2016-05]
MSETRIKIAIGGDHAGFEYKELLKDFLANYDVKDFGTYSLDSVDYPDFAHPVAAAVESGEFLYGILLCGSANGVAIAANKHAGIRAGLCWENEVASLVRKHNNANVLCIPARFVSEELAKEITSTFLDTEFEGGRHQTRVDKISC